MASISALPVELVVFVIENLDSLRDLSALSKVDRRLYSIATPYLYKAAVARNDAWPVAWASHRGTLGTLLKAITAGAELDVEIAGSDAKEIWAKCKDDIGYWKAVNECDCEGVGDECEWTPETSGSDHPVSASQNQTSISAQSEPWVDDSYDSDTPSSNGLTANFVNVTSRSPSVRSSASPEPSDYEMDTHISGLDSPAPAPADEGPSPRFRPLHLAAISGNNEIIDILLSHGVSLNTPSEGICDCAPLYGLLNATECPETIYPPPWTPLHQAICHSRSETAQLLLSRGASYVMESVGEYDRRPSLSSTALHHAAGMGLVDVVSYLVDNKIQDEIDARDDRTLTPLYHAYAKRRWSSTVPQLLRLGANISVDVKIFLPYSTITPLGEACRMGDFEEADRLIDLGANVSRGYVSSINDGGLTPLHMCCMPSAAPPSSAKRSEAARLRTVQKLIRAGSNLEARDCYGNTPLGAASQNRVVNGAQGLIEAGACVHARDHNSRTPLIQAIMGPQMTIGKGATDPVPLIGQVIDRLLASSANLSEVDKEGNTVLHSVFLTQNVGDLTRTTFQIRLLRHLISKPGIENIITAQNHTSQTPLYLAVKEGNPDACDILVRRGCLRTPLSPEELILMFRFAAHGMELPHVSHEYTKLFDFVLDIDVSNHLMSDPSLIISLLHSDEKNGTKTAFRAVQILSRRGKLPPMKPNVTNDIYDVARFNDLDLAVRLIEEGNWNPTSVGILDQLPRLTSILFGNPYDRKTTERFLEALLSRGASIYTENCPEDALTCAIRLGRDDVVRFFLSRRSTEINMRRSGSRYLCEAFKNLQYGLEVKEEIIDMLIIAGAEGSETDGIGETPLQILLQGLYYHPRFTWRYERYLRALMAPGVDVNRRGCHDKSIAELLEGLLRINSEHTNFLRRKLALVDDGKGGREVRYFGRRSGG